MLTVGTTVSRHRGIREHERRGGRVDGGMEKPRTVLSIPSRITVRGSSNHRAKRHTGTRRRGRQREKMTGSHYRRHYDAPLTPLSIPNFRKFSKLALKMIAYPAGRARQAFISDVPSFPFAVCLLRDA